MTFCAVFLGLLGIVFSFLPQESATYLSWPNTPPIVLQILGALYFGFAMVNWTARANLIGGIYGRPVAIGNFAHFMIGALALIKLAMDTPSAKMVLGVTVFYCLFALAFGYIFFTHPALKIKEKTFNTHS